jgi:hypothetical protein
MAAKYAHVLIFVKRNILKFRTGRQPGFESAHEFQFSAQAISRDSDASGDAIL